MNIQDISQNLSEITNIQDNALRLLYLRNYKKAYMQLSESEKETLKQAPKVLAQKLIQDTKALLDEKVSA